jgi:phage antirepressor YoqD-like protein
MTDDPIRDETLISLLEERGYQVTRRGDELTQRLETVERELCELKERKSPEETFAANYAKALERARSPWFSPGDREGGSDAA